MQGATGLYATDLNPFPSLFMVFVRFDPKINNILRFATFLGNGPKFNRMYD